MPLPGGAAEKYGNRYEGLWTVACMLDVMDEKADSIRLEPPDLEGQGFEFRITKQGIQEYHQVKRQRSNGQWTLPALIREGVLNNFSAKLQADLKVRCVFVSATSADPLAELSDRARGAISWDEFNTNFLSADERRKDFDRVRQSQPDVPGEEIYEQLKRVYIETIGESRLRTMIECQASRLVEGNAATVVDVLAEMASDRIHNILTGHDIWNHLQSRGFKRCYWYNNPDVLEAIGEANDRYLNLLRGQAINRTVLPRKEVQTVLDHLGKSSDKAGVLLTGEAGIGKSGVMLQVVAKLLGTRTPLVALRADRLALTQLPKDVGQQLGLPGSPATVLAAVAQGKQCVLVIDQLDALSLASGRNTNLFDCVYEIVRQAQAHPNMRILLACRKFDLDHDHRLRRLTQADGVAEAVVVERLTHETVREVVASHGLDANSLNSTQLDLLSVPLHLKLLSELVGDEEVRALNFEKAQDLYEHFWKHKEREVEKRLDRSVQWTQVVYALCDHMHEHQTLNAPIVVVEDWNRDAEAMVSENVLVLENKRYSFFHEGFFDYAYARRFARDPQSLLDLLVNGEQHLFRRAQVRQILLYLRDTDFDRYIADLETVLSSPGVRFHIKQVIFALLADLSKPKKEEWDILSRFAGRDFSDPITRLAWEIVRRPHWFQLVDCLGLVQRWLDDPDEAFVDRTVSILNVIQSEMPDRVADIVEPCVGKSERWNSRLCYLALWGDWSQGRRYLEFMLQLIDVGILDHVDGALAANSDFWLLLTNLQSNRPSWGCEVVGHYLNRRRKLSLKAGQPNPFGYNSGAIADSPFDERTLKELAGNAPEAFVREVLPFMQAVIEDCASQKPDGLLRDQIWSFRIFQSRDSIGAALLNAMETALSKLAVQKTDVFRSVIEPIRESPFETIQYLLLRSLAANGPLFADEGVDHLCKKPERLNIGYSSDSHWASRQLIESISPHCSDEKLKQLETLLLGYYSDWEKDVWGRKQFGYAQFTLLSGITETRRSEKAHKRLEEWRRKFGLQEPVSPAPTEMQVAQPPIPEDAAEKMRDGQWLSAIHRHDTDRDDFTQDGRYVGGARELSRVLENQVKREPRRFAELVLGFPDHANPFYFEAVLSGLRDTNLDIETILRVTERCHRIEGRPLGRYICGPIASSAQEEVPAEALDLVAWYATEDPDPQQELWRTPASPGGEPYFGGDILMNGNNTNRGRAAEAMARLIENDHRRITYFQPALEKMVQDPSIAVRSCVAETLLAVLRHDRDLAVTLFRQLCNTEDALLRTRFIGRFLFLALQTHFQELSHILRRMVSSQLPDVASAGARQACLAALDLQEAADIAELGLSGSEAQRIGAAQVMAAYVKTATYRSYCEDELIKLFNDSSADVRTEAAKCFSRFEGSQLEEYPHLVTQFVSSDAFQQNYTHLLMALEETTGKLPEVTLSACERFIDFAGPASSDIGTGTAFSAGTVTKLTLRIYQQSKEDTIRARSLNLIDRLMENSAYGINEALENFER
ncbi:MAG: ATP-binding protein [Caldilineaceae bacterium]|nr:ATP-binding protein [Caldilineaceae bacterium]